MQRTHTTSLLYFLLFLSMMFIDSGQIAAQGQDVYTSSPYQTIYTHLFYLQPESYDPSIASLAIDPTTVSDSTERQRAAIQLKQILDGKGLFVNVDLLPKSPDYVDSFTNQSTYVLFPNELPQVYITRVGDNWYYSKQTMQVLDEVHRSIFPLGSTFLMNLFPEFGHRVFLGLAIWQYIGLMLAVLLAVLAYYFFTRLLRPFIRQLLKKYFSKNEEIKSTLRQVDRISSAVSLLVILQLIWFIVPMLLLPIKFGAFVSTVIRIMQVLAIALILLRIANFFMQYVHSLISRTESKMDDQMFPIIRRIVQLLIFLGAALQVLNLLNVNVTALIAGVSIGGLAVALAAQDAVKNFIGSLMIFADRPFQVGDYIVGSGFEGEVVEVGFRTTRIKSIDTSIISVPNGSLSNMNVQNLGVRQLRIFNTIIGVTYDAKPEQLKGYTTDLVDLIIKHEALSNESYYVHIKELADSSINIMFRAYLDVPSYADELRIKEELIYEIMSLANKNGLSFAYPSQSIYINTDKK